MIPDTVPKRPARRQRLAELWTAYCAGRSIEDRNRLMTFYVPMVRTIANRLENSLPRFIELEDLVSAGTFGLKDAIEAFDPSRRVLFRTFAFPRVRGAMLDWIREMDWVPRLTRSRTARLEKARDRLAARLCRPPTESELCASTGLSPGEFERIARDVAVGQVSLQRKWFETESGRDVTQADLLTDPAAPVPDRGPARRETIDAVTRGFTPAERLIVVLYYFEDLTMRQIGRVLQLSESRVSQMHSALLPRIRARFSRAELETLLAAG